MFQTLNALLVSSKNPEPVTEKTFFGIALISETQESSDSLNVDRIGLSYNMTKLLNDADAYSIKPSEFLYTLCKVHPNIE